MAAILARLAVRRPLRSCSSYLFRDSSRQRATEFLDIDLVVRRYEFRTNALQKLHPFFAAVGQLRDPAVYFAGVRKCLPLRLCNRN